ncbi:MAG: hypothetical protein DDT26_00820 [Dehalococcoidia bacterium]|nr:hypothetical protein [Chloroflexota bacterium]
MNPDIILQPGTIASDGTNLALRVWSHLFDYPADLFAPENNLDPFENLAALPDPPITDWLYDQSRHTPIARNPVKANQDAPPPSDRDQRLNQELRDLATPRRTVETTHPANRPNAAAAFDLRQQIERQHPDSDHLENPVKVGTLEVPPDRFEPSETKDGAFWVIQSLDQQILQTHLFSRYLLDSIPTRNAYEIAAQYWLARNPHTPKLCQYFHQEHCQPVILAAEGKLQSIARECQRWAAMGRAPACNLDGSINLSRTLTNATTATLAIKQLYELGAKVAAFRRDLMIFGDYVAAS